MIFSVTGVIISKTRVQRFTAISQNIPVYGQQSIMEIKLYLLNKSAVCIFLQVAIVEWGVSLGNGGSQEKTNFMKIIR